MKTLGYTLAYNEQDCIQNAVANLLIACDRVLLFDHGSTDETVKRAKALDDERLEIVHVDRRKVDTSRDGKVVPDLFRYIGRWVKRVSGDFDWIFGLAADEIVRRPDKRLPRPSDLADLDRSAVDVVRPLLREFWMTTSDPRKGEYISRISWFRLMPDAQCPRLWRVRLTPDPMPRGMHLRDPRIPQAQVPGTQTPWPDGTIVSNNSWRLDHYPIRSVAQAKRKILKERPWRPKRYEPFRINKFTTIKKKASKRGMNHKEQGLEMPLDVLRGMR